MPPGSLFALAFAPLSPCITFQQIQGGFSHKNLLAQFFTTASLEKDFLCRLSTTDGSVRKCKNKSLHYWPRQYEHLQDNVDNARTSRLSKALGDPLSPLSCYRHLLVSDDSCDRVLQHASDIGNIVSPKQQLRPPWYKKLQCNILVVGNRQAFARTAVFSLQVTLIGEAFFVGF